MARSARTEGISRRSWLLAGLTIPLFRARAEARLEVSFDGDNLHVAAPGLHFLTGSALKRLKNADTVVFLSQITLFSDNFITPLRKPVQDRLVVSYAIWEDRFKVAMPGAPVPPVEGLTEAQAEDWSIRNLAVSALGVPQDRPFWLKFELRTAPRKDTSTLVSPSGLSLVNLVNFFGRKPGPDEPSWTLGIGPLRLTDLPRTGREKRIF
jgi:hypothetical protein